MKQPTKKLIAMLLTLALTLSNISMPAFAQEGGALTTPTGAIEGIVTDFDGLKAVIEDFNVNATENTTITVSGSISITSTLPAITNTNYTLTITGGTLNRSGTTSRLLQVDSGAKLVLENITLDGKKESYSANTDTLVWVYGGELTLKDDAVLTNNKAHLGGGVMVENSGSFAMTGGEISGNTAGDGGGGVFVGGGSGSFAMTGGEISGNTAANGGGGVLFGGGTFTMTGGEISGNTAGSGEGGVYVGGGTFTMTGGLVFGQGSSDIIVVYPGSWGGPSGTGIVIRWSGAENTPYRQYDTADLHILPDSGAEAYWDTDQTGIPGITYNNGANTGFIPLNVTVGIVDLGAQTIAITAPVTGQSAQDTITAGTGYTGTIDWYNVTDGASHTGAFAGSKVYKAMVTLTSTTGYQWPATTPTITVDGQTVTNMNVGGTGTGNSLAFDVTFAVTETKVNGTKADTIKVYMGTYSGSPAAWYVIGSNAATWTLLAEKNMGTSQFYGDVTSSSYDTSTLRTVVNNLLGGFSEIEKGAMNDVNLTDVTPVVNAQKLWPLSREEGKQVNIDLRNIAALWWLRTPSGSNFAAFVDADGTIGSGGRAVIYDYGVRPAFELKLSAVLFTSDSSTGGAEAADSSLTRFSATETPQNLKLTLDSEQTALNGFSITSPGAQSEIAAENLELTYSAGINSNNFIRVQLSQGGETKYTGVMASGLDNEGGTASITLTGVDPGTYDVKAWVEQGNAAKCSNIGTTPVEFSLMVNKISTTITVTAPGNITYGGNLGDPSAVTGDTVDDAAFAYHYSGTLSDGSTLYSSNDKPDEPGSYEVTATLVSGTHMGTSDPTGFTIHKKDLTWATNGTADSKNYDGTKTATADTQPTLGGVINEDDVEVQNGTISFAGADAGSDITVNASDYGIAGTDAWKYNAPSGHPVFASGIIHPKVTTFTVEPIGSLEYTGQTLTPPVVVKDGTTELTLERDYTVSYTDNTDAGAADVTIAGMGNYEGSTGSAEFTINKSTYTGEKTAVKNVLSNHTAVGVTVTLPGLPDGASYGTALVTTDNGLVTGMPSANGTTLTFDVASKEAGTTDTITIPVTGAANHTDYDVEVTITAVTKASVTISGVDVDNKTYDGTAVTKSGTPAANNGTADVDISDDGYDYEWQNANGDTLAGAPKDAGSYKLIVSVSEDNTDYTGSQEVNFTINKATVTITAEDKTATVGDSVPEYTYTVDGLASGESLKTDPALSGTPDMNKVGTYAITPGGAEVPDSRNYEEAITYENGILTVQAAQVTNVTISFQANGGTGSMESVSVRGGTYTLPSCTFSRSNYSFGGWKSGNTGAAYAAGTAIPIDGDVTLYAQWTYVGPVFTPVTNITGVPTKATVGTALTLKGTVQPGSATNRTIQWAVKSKGTTGARISGGKLQTTGSGTAVITATIRNGKTDTANYTKDFTIKASYPLKKGSTYTVSGYRYKVTSVTNSKKEVTFAGLTAAKKKTATTLNIKGTVKIKGVTMKITAVGKNALKGNNRVRTVEIGNNVRTLGYGSFRSCTALRNVTIGTGLVTIEGHTFSNDTKLKTITIKSTKLKRVNSAQVFVKVKATVKVPASRVSAYRKLFSGKSGSLKVTK